MSWSRCIRTSAQLAAAGVEWVQLDEPALVRDLDDATVAAVEQVYGTLSQAQDRPAILVASYFGSLGPALGALARTGVEGLAVDLVAGDSVDIAGLPALADKLIVAGVVDGRNVWRTDLETALATLATLLGSTGSVAVSSSCSLLHVPYTIEAESEPRRIAARMAGIRHREGRRGRHLVDGTAHRPRRRGFSSSPRRTRLPMYARPILAYATARCAACSTRSHRTALARRPIGAARSSDSISICLCCRPPPSARTRRPTRIRVAELHREGESTCYVQWTRDEIVEVVAFRRSWN